MTSTSDEVGHTATPWYRYGNVLVGPHGETIVTAHKGISFDLEANDLAEGNAEFVLRAVNSHDSLVKALEEIADPENLREPKRSDHATDDSYWMTCGIWMMALKARAALSQAKGGK